MNRAQNWVYKILCTCQTKAINWYFIARYRRNVLMSCGRNTSIKILDTGDPDYTPLSFMRSVGTRQQTQDPFSIPKFPDVLQIRPVIHHLICSNRSASHTLKTSNWFMYSLSSAEDVCLSSHTFFLSWSLYLAILIRCLLSPSFSLCLLFPHAHIKILCFCLVSCFPIRGGVYNEPCLWRHSKTDNRLLLRT